MLYFLVCMVLFFLFLLCFCISLSVILERRNDVEEYEYMLRRAYIRRYSFISGIAMYLESSDSYNLLLLKEKAMKESDLKVLVALNIEITKEIKHHIDSNRISASDVIEEYSLEKSIDDLLLGYNRAADSFNRVVFSPLNRWVARMCNMNRIERV